MLVNEKAAYLVVTFTREVEYINRKWGQVVGQKVKSRSIIKEDRQSVS